MKKYKITCITGSGELKELFISAENDEVAFQVYNEQYPHAILQLFEMIDESEFDTQAVLEVPLEAN